MDLGKGIKHLRKLRGTTQKDFSSDVGITQSYLSQIEKGRKEPSMEVLSTISKHLGVPMPVLFWFTMTELDVPKHKREIFKQLKPAVDMLIDSFFN